MTHARTEAPSRKHVPWTNAQRAHFALRLTLGVNIAAHGLVRIGHAGDFSAAMLRAFEPTMLPGWMVSPFTRVLPFAELALGLAVVLGLRLRDALMAGSLLITMLTFGSCMQQAWEVVGLQLVYALAYFVLLWRADEARLTVIGGER